MSFQRKVKEGFGKVKEDVEGVKNELAFALRRIAKIEEVLTQGAIQKLSKPVKKKKKKKLTWKQHLAKVRKKYPKKSLKQAMIIASSTYKK